MRQVLKSYPIFPFPSLLIAWIVFFMWMMPPPLQSQTSILEQPFSLSVKNVTVGDALDSISGKVLMYFTYNASLFEEEKIVSLQVENKPLKDVLHQILEDTSIHFQIVKKQIIISRHFDSFPGNNVINENNQKHFLILGKVFDLKTGKALPYANLGILGKLKGTTTNAEGTFMLSISTRDVGDTLKVSFIGYKNALFILSDTLTNDLEIGLQQDLISLQEVIIRTSEPLSLIKSALRKFPENYMQVPANYNAFYRELVKKNKEYMIYLESILDIYKSPYQTALYEKDYARIIKSRKTFDANILDTVSFRLQGGIEGCLLLDIVKNPPDFLQEELFPYYDFKLENIDTYNEQAVYVIECSPKSNIKEPLLQGRLYIETRNLAIVRAEFQYPDHMVSKLSSRFITRKSSKIRATPTLLSYTVNYRYLNGKYYLSHSMGHLKFRIKNTKKIFSSIFEIKFELATTQVITEEVHKIRWKERVPSNTILSKEKMEYDADFWGNSSFIEPEEEIQDALMRLPSTSY